ncbi:NAD(P)/FAD-dependent oxidoreductase [Zeaxanthinibacter sp. PT1]|uniref:NAD(P)/FAD-dependent oxidoreductase n=1 Tax=Zeaxanthinibacter TaxID=561554 RepID=UPI0023496DD0|nr:NAD(P)/FAD-dependent oxidoreductase [Zeaxanthinibacter sp. PT1]MDC6351465.1 NAD(P)/FAD-dependent oxidoreductase [Zeaxanthinibacter sp. PT1]
MKRHEVIIVGGGLAGLTAAIDLAVRGREVLIIEKHAYPRHKVCGEYLSGEVWPYLHTIGVELPGAITIDTLSWSVPGRRPVETRLPLGGVGISRYGLDALLYQKACDAGVQVLIDAVTDIKALPGCFQVRTKGKVYESRVVLGAYGKRESLDKSLGRQFISRKSPWLAVKAHYHCQGWPDRLVGLHTFKGGYGGLSKTELGTVNFCYLVRYDSFKRYRNMTEFKEEVISENRELRHFLRHSKMVFDKPMSIAQISFGTKNPVDNGLLMIGDTAGVIHPLCGNGMAMAIHSASIAARLVHQYLSTSSDDLLSVRREYRRLWQANFRKRLMIGSALQTVLLNDSLASLSQATIARSPSLLRAVIRATHGKGIPI